MINVRTLRFIFSFQLILFFVFTSSAQVGINTETPDASAALDITSPDKGLLIPRVDTSAISNPAIGLMVFRPADNGFYFYNGNKWQLLGSVVQSTIADSDGDTKIQVEKNPDEDVIRMDIKGKEGLLISSDSIGRTRMEFTNNNNNIALGNGVLQANTDGDFNIGIGVTSLYSNTTGNRNVALGHRTLDANTIGSSNVATGFGALQFNEEGSYNVGLGFGALNANSSGNYNVASGHEALISNDKGNNNVAAGAFSLNLNTQGSQNIAIGYNSLRNADASDNIAIGDNAIRGVAGQTTGENNIAIGDSALFSNTSGYRNIAQGTQSLFSNSIGHDNISFGHLSLYNNTTGDHNIAMGDSALFSNTIGKNNIAMGSRTLFFNSNGTHNVALGYESLFNNNKGDVNIAIGWRSLHSNIEGSDNVSIGSHSLFRNTSNNNVAVGENALYQNRNGEGNVALGYDAGAREKGSNKLYIENTDADSIGALIYGEFDNDFIRLNGEVVLRDGWRDSDGDTRIYLEKNPDEDIIRIDLKGQEKFRLDTDAFGRTRIQFPNNNNNIGIGASTLSQNLSGINNVAIGLFSFQENTSGSNNVAVGPYAMNKMETGGSNTAFGEAALEKNTGGHNNTSIGAFSLRDNTAGSGNVALGYNAGRNETGSDKLYIENTSAGANNALIYGDFDNDNLRFNARVGVNGYDNDVPFLIQAKNSSEDLFRIRSTAGNIRLEVNDVGDLWIQGTLTENSDRRLKKSIMPLSSSLSSLLALNGYHYYWKDADRSPALQTGLIAQEVQEVFPELVSEKESRLSLNYSGLIPHLIEGMKEQQEMIKSLKSEIDALKEMMIQLSAETSEE